MKDFLLIENGKIKLSSGLDEIKFGKTKFSSIISQQGMLFDGENFTPWTFDEVKSFEVSENDNKIVFYCGNSVFSDKAKTLLDYFEDGDREKMFTAAFEVCKALTKAAVEKNSIPIIGAGGIIVDISQEKAKILFLPQTLFINSCAGLSAKDKANLLGCWINETLTDLPAICFLRATIAYTMLTGQFPFPQVDVTERNADILDKKFLPLEMRLPNVPPKLAKEINEALWLTSTRVQLPGKKQTGKASDELTPVADFSLDLLEAERNDIPSAALQKELEAKKSSVKVLEEEYTEMAKKIQDLRTKKKEKEAKDLEAKFAELRKQTAKASGELQQFFDKSQQELYALEDKEMGNLAKEIEKKVEKIIQDIAKKNKLKAVFAKPTTFWTDEKAVYDMTDEVIKTLNK